MVKGQGRTWRAARCSDLKRSSKLGAEMAGSRLSAALTTTREACLSA